MKKILIWLVCGFVLVVLTACTTALIIKKNSPNKEVNKNVFVKQAVNPQNENTDSEKETSDLYSDTIYDLPLVSIVDISKLSPEVKKTVDGILENSQGFYYLKYNEKDKKVFIILQNPVSERNFYQRHELETATVNEDGSVNYTEVGYSGEAGEIENAVIAKGDIWEFDESVEPYRPLKHIAYAGKKRVEFVETWNYDSENPVKYEMQDGNGKAISILKETVTGDSNYRKEHIFYDDSGHIKMSLSVNYEGANITRMTFYEAGKDASLTIISDYTDGLKTKETIYNQDYALQKTLEAVYDNGVRKSIKLIDKDGSETVIEG